MRYLFLIITILIPLTPIFAITGEDSRFDWSLGQPAITDDTTSACNNEAVARFDWVLGQPAIVFDATATCTAGAPADGVTNFPNVFINSKAFINEKLFIGN